MLETPEINIEPLSARNENEWDGLVQIAHNGHLMARPGYFRYHEDRFEDASLFIRLGNRPLAVLPANRDGDILWSHQGVSFGGLILYPRARFAHVGGAVEALLEFLRREGFKRLMYRPAPHPYHALPREDDLYWLERAGARRVDTKLHSMTICGSAAAVRSKTSGRHFRRAMERGLHIREGFDADLPVIWELIERLLSNHGQRPVHSLEEMELLRERFPEEVRLDVVEDVEGELLAGKILLRSGRTLTGLYLGESARGREMGAGLVLNHHYLNAAENAGFWFDLGQWCDTDTRESSDSLLSFKESMGGRLIQRHTWQLDL